MSEMSNRPFSFTSPLRGEVAATRRVGVIWKHSSILTPPRAYGSTLPLKGRVSCSNGGRC